MAGWAPQSRRLGATLTGASTPVLYGVHPFEETAASFYLFKDSLRPVKMKLLYVHDRFGAFAGAETNIFLTAAELARRGWTVGILHGEDTGKGQMSWKSVFEHRFRLAGAESVAGALNSFHPDVIYLHNLTDLEVLQALLETGAPIARMVHDHNLYCMRSYKYNYFTRRICERAASPYCVFPCGAFLARNHQGAAPVKWVSYAAKTRELELNRKFGRLIVATDFMKRELLRNGFNPERIEIHAPVPRFDESVPRSNFSDRNLIVYSGQVTRGKGVDVLIRSLAHLTIRFECLILGEGNHRAHCEKLCQKLGLADRVRFEGFVDPEQMGRHYRECSVVVMSSVWPEPFGAAGLEGMRYGLPVVAFDAGGIKEWLSDGFNGFLAPWMDRRIYARRIETLLRNKPLARAMGEWGRQTVAQQFSFSKYIDGLENLFERCGAPGPISCL
jgi:glycosyltransferase involved in cell wall biosynthesis